MKLFKKLLAVAMVAVLALTVLTGCDAGTTDPDAVYPDDETENVVCALNNGAAAANQPQFDLQCEVQQDYKGTAG